MERLFLLFGLSLAGCVLGVSGEDLLGGNRCTWGPSYWCSRLNSSAECGAVQHCSERVWTQQSEPRLDQSVSCRGCVTVLGTIKEAMRQDLSSVATMSKVRQACMRQFSLYPSHLDLCVNSIGFHLMKDVRLLIQTGVPDRTICALLDLCRFDDMQVLQDEQQLGLQVSARDVCQDCVNFMQDVHDMYLSPIVQEVVTQYFEMQCDKIPSGKEQCKAEARARITQLFNYLRNHFDSHNICSTMKMCTTGEVWGSPVDSIGLQDIDYAVKFLSNLHLLRAPEASHTIVGNAECMLCEWAVQLIDRQLADNATQQDIEQALQQVCTYIPSRYQPKCARLVETYGPEIIEALSQSLDPELVCQSAGACEPSDYFLELVGGFQDEECDQCKAMAQQMIDTLKSPEGQRDIENLLESFCRYLPSSYQQQCDQFVDNLVPQLITYLLATVTPVQMCHYFKLC